MGRLSVWLSTLVIMETIIAQTSYSNGAFESAFFMSIFFWILVFGAIGAAIGSSKGQTGTGLILGALLGIIGIIILLFMKPIPKPNGAQVIGSATVVGWHSDPFNRFQMRYYDGTRWTGYVSTNGVAAVDEPPADAATWVAPPIPQVAPQPSRLQSTAPTFGAPPTRKWDKASKQWLIAGPDGHWTPENPQTPIQGAS